MVQRIGWRGRIQRKNASMASGVDSVLGAVTLSWEVIFSSGSRNAYGICPYRILATGSARIWGWKRAKVYTARFTAGAIP